MTRRLFLPLLPLTFLGCIVLLYATNLEIKRNAISAINAQQFILASQAAKGIQDFFTHHRKSLEALAQNPHIQNLDHEGQNLLDDFLIQNRPEIKALTRMDAHGRITFTTRDHSSVGRDISSQAHVQDLLKLHTPVISDVFTPVQGESAVALHVPVFKGATFDGSLAVLIAFNMISKRYLEDIQVGRSGYAFVLSAKGVELFCPVPGHVGRTIFETSVDAPDVLAMAERMLKGESGEAVYLYRYIKNQKVNGELKHAVFMPIHLENTFWSICVATPESEILAGLRQFHSYIIPLGAVIVAVFILGVYLIVRHLMLQNEIVRRRATEDALRASEHKYRSVIKNITDVFYRTDAAGRLEMVSPSGAGLLGYESELGLIGQPIESFWLHPEKRSDLLQALRKHGEVRDYEVELKHKDGLPVFVSTSSRLITDADGNVLGVEGTFRDITTRKASEAALRKSVQQFNSLFDNMAEGVALLSLVRNTSGQITDYIFQSVNRSFEFVLGHPPEKVCTRRGSEVFETAAPPLLEEFRHVSISGNPRHVETFLPQIGKHVSVSVAPWVDDGISAIFTDITDHKHLEEQLVYRALHDPLTGLANRTLCLDRIGHACERASRDVTRPFAVVFIDIHRFKVINDSLGHEAGDQVLCEVADRLQTCVRRVDTICRYGGDEFTLLLEELSPRETVRCIRRIRTSLSAIMTIGTHQIQIEACYGIAFSPGQMVRPEELLRNANIALHRAKLLGRNRMTVYRSGMHEAAIQSMNLQSEMLRGLHEGEFFIVFQPIYRLDTDLLAGFEALVRWHHPKRGLISPGEFIPLAEETGFIYPLGNFILVQACSEMARLLLSYPDSSGLTVSVNLSPRQFSRRGLIELIEQVISDTGLPPSALVLEITESSILAHPEAAAHTLARFKDKGVGIAIDDFGTGYSSMSVLQKLPLDRLKIDMSFVRRITDSEEDREIIRAIITLAHSLRLKTVAEGVETEPQRALLRGMGCDLAQGYLCGRPMPLELIPEVIERGICAKT